MIFEKKNYALKTFFKNYFMIQNKKKYYIEKRKYCNIGIKKGK